MIASPHPRPLSSCRSADWTVTGRFFWGFDTFSFVEVSEVCVALIGVWKHTAQLPNSIAVCCVEML